MNRVSEILQLEELRVKVTLLVPSPSPLFGLFLLSFFFFYGSDRSLTSFSTTLLKLQHMQLADVDWKNIKSKYVRDEVYEHINAPKWINLAAPDASPVDDEAWFFRPGHRGPLKTKAAAPKKFGDHLENQNPNLSTPPPASRSFGAPRRTKTAKEMIQSSAEKVEEEREEWQQQKKSQPRHKNTLSARNLFSGKDILCQISEFCQELKKLTVGSERPAAQEGRLRRRCIKISILMTGLMQFKCAIGKMACRRDGGSGKKSGKMATKVEVEEEKYKKGFYENSSILREVRACPPTPQHIPSPSNRRLRNPKATATTCSPLN
ncbi:uncharacterized protein LOC103724109 [Phoenix dactylifera]|uniref:Uncharacterized protein LOC103724109 n=1 Tax=Phoenix dactylifera TaxID=42345 RepID=A0A8B8ZTC4_PHODC|nr:uncharacterized protein LOC103724109 [Phoenix dactylifera]